MNIFGAIKKSINSDLNKPLDVILGEIQRTVDNSRVASRKIRAVVGVPYNETVDNQVINTSDPALLSISGSGRILEIVPLTSETSGYIKFGTVLLTVDGSIVFNSKTIFGGSLSDYKGIYVLTNTDTHKSTVMYCDLFTDNGTHYVDTNPFLRINLNTYTSVQSTLIAPHGVPFNNGFEIRMTQSSAETSVDTHGVVVVYELYE